MGSDKKEGKGVTAPAAETAEQKRERLSKATATAKVAKPKPVKAKAKDAKKPPKTPPKTPPKKDKGLTAAQLEKGLGLVRAGGEDDAVYGHRLTKEVEALVTDENRSVYESGKRLVIIETESLYQEESFNAFLAAHRTSNWGRAKSYEVMSQVKDFVLGKVAKVKVERLERIGWVKVREVHGLIAKGVVDIDVALGAAQSLSMQDLIREKADWVLADAKKRGLKPQLMRACQTCTGMTEEDLTKGTSGNRLWLGHIVEGKEAVPATAPPGPDNPDQPDPKDTFTVIGKPTRLQARSCVYCSKRGLMLALNRSLNSSEGTRFGETCSFYEESI